MNNFLRTIPEDGGDPEQQQPAFVLPPPSVNGGGSSVCVTRSVVSVQTDRAQLPTQPPPRQPEAEKKSQRWGLYAGGVVFFVAIVVAIWLVALRVDRTTPEAAPVSPPISPEPEPVPAPVEVTTKPEIATISPTVVDTSDATAEPFDNVLPEIPFVDTEEPELDPAMMEKLQMLILNLTSVEDLNREGSPQNMARDWVIHSDYLRDDVMESDNFELCMTQRYVLAVLYYSIWDAHMRPDASECNWPGVQCRSTTNELEVTHLDWSMRGLSGTVPSEVRGLRSLLEVNLASNSLTGSMPQWGSDDLFWVDVSNNTFSGTLESFWQLPMLRFVYLHDNKFSGDFPADANPDMLVDCWLQQNQLGGGLPTTWEMPDLQTWRSWGNQLTGSLWQDPPSTLVQMDTSQNYLSGSIPAVWFSLPNLEYLYLDNNALSGSLPTVSNSTMSIRRLWLQDNQLTGTIPAGFGQDWTSLKELYLHNNTLRGTLECGDWANLTGATSDCSVACDCCDNQCRR